jgi:hypothetical protein
MAVSYPMLDALGWDTWLALNYPQMQAGAPPPGWQPDPSMVQLAGFPDPNFQPNPYYALATGGANYLPKPQGIYSHFVPDAEYSALQNIPSGTTGRDLIQYLPAHLRPQGTPAQIADLQNTYNQLNAAWQADPSNIEARTQVALANQALMTAQYGPMWQAINSTTGIDDLLRKLQPQSALYRPPAPLTKADHAAQYGYGEMSNPRQGRTFDTGQVIDYGNIRQTLGVAGWDVSKGYGPQTFTNPVSGEPYDAARQKQLNSMLYAMAPTTPGVNMALQPRHPAPDAAQFRSASASKPGSSAPRGTPTVGMGGAAGGMEGGGGDGKDYDKIFNDAWTQAQVDAYNQEQMGGNFYGGVIPETMRNPGPPGAPWDLLNAMGIEGKSGDHRGQIQNSYGAWIDDPNDPRSAESYLRRRNGLNEEEGAFGRQMGNIQDNYSQGNYPQDYSQNMGLRAPTSPAYSPSAQTFTPSYQQQSSGQTSPFGSLNGGNWAANWASNGGGAWGGNTESESPWGNGNRGPWG